MCSAGLGQPRPAAAEAFEVSADKSAIGAEASVNGAAMKRKDCSSLEGQGRAGWMYLPSHSERRAVPLSLMKLFLFSVLHSRSAAYAACAAAAAGEVGVVGTAAVLLAVWVGPEYLSEQQTVMSCPG